MAAPLLQEHPPPLGTSRIARLTPTTAQLVRSAAVVPSLPRILAELVQNSIDASATSISCTVDLDTCTIRCDDNGRGFTTQDLDCLARAQRYSTSKVTLARIDNGQQKVPSQRGEVSPAKSSSSSYYGSRGEALVSLQYVATVEIRTRTLHDPVPRELVLRQGMCLAHGESPIERPNHGASVVVRDIFHNLPVRRRALEKPAAHNSLVSSLRATLASLALIHPAIAFSLVDKTSSLSTNTTGSKTLLSVRPSPSGLVSARWRQLWGPTAVGKVHEFAEEENEAVNGGECRAKGFFSLAPAHTKAQQHIYVNSDPLSATHSSLHKLVNSLFEASTFAKHASAASAPSPPAVRLRSGSQRQQQQQQQKRSLERHPVFALALEVPAGSVHVAFEQENGVTVEFEEPARFEAFVSGIVKRFLVQHGFASAPITKKLPPFPAAPAPSSSSLDASLRKKRPRSDSSAQTGIEAGMREDVVTSDGDRAAMTSGTRSLSGLERRTVAAAGGAVKASVPLLAIAGPAEPDTGATDDGQPPEMMRWIDPVTNILWEIDTRTGNSRRLDPARLHHHRPAASREPERGGAAEPSPPPSVPATRGGALIVDRSALRSRNEGLNNSTEMGAMPEWLEAKLATWTNPVFPSVRPETRIPTLPVLPIASNLAQSSLRGVYPSSKKKRFVDTAAATKPTRKDMDAFCCTSAMLTTSVPEPMSIPMAKISSSSSVQIPDPASASAPSSTPFSGQTFSRQSLARAEFVAQVDRKYLLAKLPETTSMNVAGDLKSRRETTQTLILVDQHAASERVRVERFLDATVGNVARGEPIATIRIGPDAGSDPDEAERVPRGLNNRIGVVVGWPEYELAQQYRTVFARWGFALAFDDDDEAFSPSSSSSLTTERGGSRDGDYHQIWLESVPELVSNRLLAKDKNSHIAQELVRSFVAHFEENGPGVAGDAEYTAAAAAGRGSSGGGDGGGRRRGRGGWTSAVKDAPPVLIELLNSKACRGAIMFNDELSAAQAESLLAKLAETIYPFQCAHGRPSVVPVVNLAPPQSRVAEATNPGVVNWSRLM